MSATARHPAYLVRPGLIRPVAPAGHGAFDAALAGRSSRLCLDDGRCVTLPARRWHAAASKADQWLLRQCHGPTLDLGCGPGRMVEALLTAGVSALGVDCSPVAVSQCRARGVPVVHGDVFGPLPRSGEWQHVLLADGNIGIGGDPLALLRRAASLLNRDGSVLVETGTSASGWWSGQACLHDDSGGVVGSWFPWAFLDLSRLADLARGAELSMVDVHRGSSRCFARLSRRTASEADGLGSRGS
ncbi:hypothetical protein CFN78_21130 [Amycolatopsis antarctica]|uniref:Methyltransferase domain-containing protein n=1 Tax=Amycolatopsis antarctica TaxID=1854586 RepID=A0A263CZI8_9PSEU|nr:class I SAM-dependent methyltransferase [Amycolatopsis antarctica]OZM71298.1 hypothetical protein CFN78_21130 [Amycolatopsis antarctica]